MDSAGGAGSSLLVEGYTLWVAKKVVWKQKGEESLWEYIGESSDPTGYAVLFEDSVAVVGVTVAAAGIWLTVTTGNPVFDGVAAIIIAIMMLAMATFLLFINITLITGRSDQDLEKAMKEFILDNPNVERVHRISTEMRGAEIVSANVWVELNEWAIYRHVSNGSGESIPMNSREIVEMSYARITEIVDSLRRSIMQQFPEIQFICIEPEFPRAKPQ